MKRKNAWDSNLVKANPKYVSVNWDASGGGAFAVIPLCENGKLHETIPLFRGHTGAVLDTDWNPFDDDMVASASDDGTVGIFRVPENFTLKIEPAEGESEPEIKDVHPIKKLKGHSKKVGHVLFHPTAKDVLASASGDCTVKIWNVETEEVLATLKHNDFITGLSFNETGSMLATTSRDKRLRIWDIRAEKIISETQAHSGAKSQRVVWLGNADRVVTTGFDKSDRQFALWDIYNLENGPIGGFHYIGPSSGICMPFYDEGTHMIYLAGKGDGNIMYYEYADDKIHPLSEYQSGEPQRGVAVLPRRGLDVQNHEIFRAFKTVNDTAVEPISFIIPRKSETFQEDVYPAARAKEPALTADEWASGKDSDPKVISLAAVFDGKENIESYSPPPDRETGSEKKPEVKATPKADTKSVRDENITELKSSSEKDVSSENNDKPAASANSNKVPFDTPIANSGENKNIDKVLQGSTEVSSLLNKAINDDEPEIKPNKVEDSGWGSDDDKPEVKQIVEPSIKSSAINRGDKYNEKGKEPTVSTDEKEDSVVQKESAIKESSLPDKTNDKESSEKSEPSQPVKTEIISNEKENSTAAVPVNTVETNTTHENNNSEPHSIETLSKQVNGLNSSIEQLTEKLKSRDEKIDRLEEKIEQLLSKF